jgi:hypothetical protein
MSRVKPRTRSNRTNGHYRSSNCFAGGPKSDSLGENRYEPTRSLRVASIRKFLITREGCRADRSDYRSFSDVAGALLSTIMRG